MSWLFYANKIMEFSDSEGQIRECFKQSGRYWQSLYFHIFAWMGKLFDQEIDVFAPKTNEQRLADGFQWP